MFKRIKNLWELSRLQQYQTVDKEIVLKEPTPRSNKKKQLASIVELDKPDMFPKEPSIEL